MECYVIKFVIKILYNLHHDIIPLGSEIISSFTLGAYHILFGFASISALSENGIQCLHTCAIG